jgi:hypothetical protein
MRQTKQPSNVEQEKNRFKNTRNEMYTAEAAQEDLRI